MEKSGPGDGLCWYGWHLESFGSGEALADGFRAEERGKVQVQRQRTFVISRLTLRSWIAACITELAVDI